MVPKTLAALFADVEKVGGHVEEIEPRLWSVFIPVLMVGDYRADVMIGRVGYFVRDGKNHIGGAVPRIRRRLARHV